ncbi:hypothetical protein ACP_1990 [Acidobacterium capsulatum ATCC 51196]|uniref:Uncharacterized protein n=1 Tax=Acidobacterium capsulatum (strain ATCC 51196 / DSM 11244 / BCRC 80197 / JCM 7670 / NBRC 15755 / NCIMB 13165 / 161) TaxID=240015 RepID=C1F8T4_ACIC5|nr:hypothetical protein ACP_1990 [Acidobacterium capsulatum ATCC 51196]
MSATPKSKSTSLVARLMDGPAGSINAGGCCCAGEETSLADCAKTAPEQSSAAVKTLTKERRRIKDGMGWNMDLTCMPVYASSRGRCNHPLPAQRLRRSDYPRTATPEKEMRATPRTGWPYIMAG